MIFDTFLYNGEQDILDIRLNELKDIVDHFIICESTHTFSGKPKELTFRNKYNLPVDYLVYDTKPFLNPWTNEAKQREFILANLEVGNNDIIMLSDVDEIPDKQAVKIYTKEPYVCQMRWFYYYLNYEITEKWKGTVIARRKDIKSMEKLRRSRNGLPYVNTAGWHFSFLGDIDSIIKKIESFSHWEYNNPYYKNKDRLAKLIKNKKDLFGIDRTITKVDIDDTYPQFILKNKKRFDKYIAKE